jgi:hypothetical protein
MQRWLILLGLFLGSVGVALAAVTPGSIVTLQAPAVGMVQFLQGTDNAGTYKTLFTAGVGGTASSSGSKCNAMWLTTDDGTATHLVTVQVSRGGIRYGGVAVATTLGQGFVNGTPPLNLFAPTIWPGLPLDSDGNPYLQLMAGDLIQATFATALTAATRISIVVSCGDY